jgi:hypothetical protein
MMDGGFEIRRDDLVSRLRQYDAYFFFLSIDSLCTFGPVVALCSSKTSYVSTFRAPFTLQRICEMLSDQGMRHYKTADKYMFAFEKVPHSFFSFISSFLALFSSSSVLSMLNLFF